MKNGYNSNLSANRWLEFLLQPLFTFWFTMRGAIHVMAFNPCYLDCH